jgi:hypothetical protein
MNENVKKWVKALRSGDYRQAKEALHVSGAGFCCLGVACDLYMKENPEWKWQKGGRCMFFSDGVESVQGTLPQDVQEWLDLRSDDGTYMDGTRFISLAEMNDNGATFDEIADIIESAPVDMFGYNVFDEYDPDLD